MAHLAKFGEDVRCETDYARLCDLGAPGIITNAPARLAAWLRCSTDKAGAAMRMG